MTPASRDLLDVLDARIAEVEADLHEPQATDTRYYLREKRRALLDEKRRLEDNLPRVEAQAVDMMRGVL